ncbi:transposase [Nocardia sp. 2YAB30]|uniref:transposase n=1 Tax=unclassified Nocardia TaxID=2637762 RepID=UPI003F9AEB42
MIWKMLQAFADAAGAIVWEVSVDSTISRAHRHAAGPRHDGHRQAEPPGGGRRRTGRSRPRAVAGWLETTKTHLTCEQGRKVLSIVITTGQRGDSPQFTAVLNGIAVPRLGRGRPHTGPGRVRADKAYSSRANRAHLRRHGIKATIPIKADQVVNRNKKGSAGGRPSAFDAEDYKKRHSVECGIGQLEETVPWQSDTTVRMKGCRLGRWSDPRYDWPSGPEFDLSSTVRGGACCRRTGADVSR